MRSAERENYAEIMRKNARKMRKLCGNYAVISQSKILTKLRPEGLENLKNPIIWDIKQGEKFIAFHFRITNIEFL